MYKRRLIAIAIAVMLTFAATVMWSAATIQREGDPDANVMEDSGSLAGEATESEGEQSPEGWLWTTMTAAAEWATAGANTSRGWTRLADSVPIETVS